MHTPANEKTLQRLSPQSQNKMRLQRSNNKDQCLQSDCINKARNHMLLEFLHSSTSATYFFTIIPQDRNVALNLMATITRSPRKVV